MKRLISAVLALAVVAVLTTAVLALSVNTVSIGWPIAQASGANELTFTVLNGEWTKLPSGIMLWTADGSTFYINYKDDYNDDGTPIYGAKPLGVPGAATLPLPMALVGADSTTITILANCPTDSLFGFWVR